MIQINKPKQIPEVLSTRGTQQHIEFHEQYNLYSTDYQNGTRKFDFDNSIYAHEDVKTSLLEAQHGKCCFCESKIEHIAYGDVEHFRPKGGYCQSSEDTLHKPGYYWLAYDWQNLLICCSLCNQRYKKNLFPLSNPNDRVTSPEQDINQEIPLFINPSVDNPENFISFREEEPYALENNERGTTTIECLGLKRRPLTLRRQNIYRKMKMLFQTMQTMELLIEKDSLPIAEKAECTNLVENSKVEIQKLIENDSEYSAMFRIAIIHNFSYP